MALVSLDKQNTLEQSKQHKSFITKMQPFIATKSPGSSKKATNERHLGFLSLKITKSELTSDNIVVQIDDIEENFSISKLDGKSTQLKVYNWTVRFSLGVLGAKGRILSSEQQFVRLSLLRNSKKNRKLVLSLYSPDKKKKKNSNVEPSSSISLSLRFVALTHDYIAIEKLLFENETITGLVLDAMDTACISGLASDKFVAHFVRIYYYNDQIFPLLLLIVNKELTETILAGNCELFLRENSVGTQVISELLAVAGTEFLKVVLALVRKFAVTKKLRGFNTTFEVNNNKMVTSLPVVLHSQSLTSSTSSSSPSLAHPSSPSSSALPSNTHTAVTSSPALIEQKESAQRKLFTRLVSHLTDSILKKMEKKFKVLSDIIRILCKELVNRVHSKFDNDPKKFKEVRMIIMNGILFLRYIAPAIVSPERSGLEKIVCPPEVCKLLIEVAKVLLQIGIGKKFDDTDKNAIYNEIVVAQLPRVERFFDKVLEVEETTVCAIPLKEIKPKMYVTVVKELKQREKDVLKVSKSNEERKYLPCDKLSKEQKKLVNKLVENVNVLTKSNEKESEKDNSDSDQNDTQSTQEKNNNNNNNTNNNSNTNNSNSNGNNSSGSGNGHSSYNGNCSSNSGSGSGNGHSSFNGSNSGRSN